MYETGQRVTSPCRGEGPFLSTNMHELHSTCKKEQQHSNAHRMWSRAQSRAEERWAVHQASRICALRPPSTSLSCSLARLTASPDTRKVSSPYHLFRLRTAENTRWNPGIAWLRINLLKGTRDYITSAALGDEDKPWTRPKVSLCQPRSCTISLASAAPAAQPLWIAPCISSFSLISRWISSSDLTRRGREKLWKFRTWQGEARRGEVVDCEPTPPCVPHRNLVAVWELGTWRIEVWGPGIRRRVLGQCLDGDFQVCGFCIAVADGGSRMAQEGGAAGAQEVRVGCGHCGLQIRVRAAGL